MKASSILLIHGLGRTSKSLMRMARAIEATGHSAIAVDYPSRRGTIEEQARFIYSSLRGGIPTGATVSFVTHSMGGLVARAFVSMYENEFSFERAVMLAPPSLGARSAQALNAVQAGRWFFGPALSEIAEKRLPPTGGDRMQIGIVSAQTGWKRGVLVDFDEPNDGIVTTAESHLADAKDHIVVKGVHTFIMLNSVVIEQTIHFLENGMFRR